MGFYADFVAGLASVTVDGVALALTAPPEQINTADLPIMYPRVPTGGVDVELLDGDRGLRRATCELVVVLESFALNSNDPNFSLSVGMLDAMSDALTLAAPSLFLDSWQMRVEVASYGLNNNYWILIASVQASG